MHIVCLLLVQQESSDQQRARQAERTPERALFAQAETPVVYLALTACFSDKNARNRSRTTALVEIITTLHLHRLQLLVLIEFLTGVTGLRVSV